MKNKKAQLLFFFTFLIAKIPIHTHTHTHSSKRKDARESSRAPQTAATRSATVRCASRPWRPVRQTRRRRPCGRCQRARAPWSRSSAGAKRQRNGREGTHDKTEGVNCVDKNNDDKTISEIKLQSIFAVFVRRYVMDAAIGFSWR
jgi:hypothetical protein